jgi:hypothetical protein
LVPAVSSHLFDQSVASESPPLELLLWTQHPSSPTIDRSTTTGGLLETACLLGQKALAFAQRLLPAMPQQLSAKEQSLFRTVVRNYEDKQYKKGTT